jgi:nucleoside-diphosphate-sugar epimerase
MRLFVFGFGYSARAIVKRMRPRLDAVWGTTRDFSKTSDMGALGVVPFLFDGDRLETRPSPSPSPSPQGGGELAEALAQADQLLVSIAPGEAGDPVLAHFRNDLAALEPKALVYLSTVGVYGDHGGAWVDEASECRPVSKRSRQRLQAEQAWRLFSEETGVPVAIVRLAGIYGPGRGPFEKIRKGTARRIVKPGQVFNRIHVDDIAAIVEVAFARRAAGVFNGADDEPAPPQDVLAYAAELLGLRPPPDVAFEEAELSPMARSFYGENKRVRNARIKDELGVRLSYPTYREGLAATLRAEAPAEPAIASAAW